MNIQTNKQSNGSVLVVSLVTITIILTSLASYLLLVLNEKQATTRDQGWNACVPVMEAGVEEALTQIHYCGGNLSNLSSNNWTLGTDGNYHKARTVGTDSSHCQVTIQPVNPPIIYSEAYVPAPVSYQNAYYTSNNFVKREVRVATKMASPYGGGLTSKAGITFGGGAYLDSYNSANGSYNPAIHGTNAVAITDSSAVGAINLTGGGDIYGMAVTGPAGTVSTVATSGTAAVGDTNWIGSGQIGIEPGWSADDANVQFNDVAAPYTTGVLPAPGLLGLTNYTYLLNGALASHYLMSSMTLVNSQTVLVMGNVTLYITGNLSIGGQAQIIIAPGSSLTLYLGGSMKVTGQGIANETMAPANFTLYGLPTCTSISYAGGDNFYGVVDAPEASLSFSGGSGAFGAFVANDITVKGQGGVHYDDALGSAGNYAVASWNEITPQ